MNKRVSMEDRETRKPSRPVSIMFQQQEQKATVRQTYHMDPVVVEAIKVINYETREGISNILNRILMEAIPQNYLDTAYKNLEGRK